MMALCGWAGMVLPLEMAAAMLKCVESGAAAGQPRDVIRLQGSLCELAAAGSGIDGYQDADGSAVIAGRPLWLGASSPLAGGIARRVVDAYRVSGADALKCLGGSFAIALTLDGGRTALLAIDRMGIGSITYCAVEQGLLFGTSADFVNAGLDPAPAIDLQSLYNYVFLHMVPGSATIFRDQSRIPPGGFVELKNGKIASGRYWEVKYDERAGYDINALKEEFRSLLEQSVARLLNGRATGTFLSGGTDSSTVTGMFAKLTGARARTYSIGFKADGYDEIEYARTASRHFATDHHEYYVTPEDVLALAPRLAEFCDQPFGNASAVPTYYCAQLAKSDGIEMLLGGDGGDELFGGNERYATQAMFSWYDRVPGILRKGLIEPVLFGVPGADRVPLLRRGRSYVKQVSMPVPMRLHLYNMLRRNPLDAVFTDEYLAQIDPAVPINLLQAVYQGADARSSLNRMLAMDLQFTLADNDLYKVNRMCDLAGVEVAYPFLNDDLVAFSTSLPTHLKLRGTKLRYFFKEALKDFLPAEIITKQKHGFGLPIGVWMQTHGPLRSLAYEAVRAFGTRGIVQPAFIDRVFAEHQAGHAAYWGGEIWNLSQLEFWLQTHGWAPGKALL
jgi:asparagine synthase (glutamine-hydrolysing)